MAKATGVLDILHIKPTLRKPVYKFLYLIFAMKSNQFSYMSYNKQNNGNIDNWTKYANSIFMLGYI